MINKLTDREGIKAEVIDYIRNSGENIEDYDIEVIVDNLTLRYRLEGEESYRDIFEYQVFEGRIAD